MTDQDQPMTDAAAGPQELPPGTRLLLRLVYIMGVVLVLLLIVLVGGIIWKATRPAQPPVVAPAVSFDLGLQPGETVEGVTLDGDRMAVTTSAGIVIVDLRKHRIEARIAHRP